jgi:hypothetical protein
MAIGNVTVTPSLSHALGVRRLVLSLLLVDNFF